MVVGALVFIVVGIAYDGPRRVELRVQNDFHKPLVVFVDGYYVSTVSPGQDVVRNRTACRGECVIEVTDTDGHVLCALGPLEEGIDSYLLAISVGGTISHPLPDCDRQRVRHLAFG